MEIILTLQSWVSSDPINRIHSKPAALPIALSPLDRILNEQISLTDKDIFTTPSINVYKSLSSTGPVHG